MYTDVHFLSVVKTFTHFLTSPRVNYITVIAVFFVRIFTKKRPKAEFYSAWGVKTEQNIRIFLLMIMCTALNNI